MQLALFHTPPAERRRQSTSGRVGAPSGSKGKRGIEVRLARRADAPAVVSDPRLSFLKPPASPVEETAVEFELREPIAIEPALDQGGVELEDVGARAGEPSEEASAELAPHPTRGKLLPPEVLTEVEIRALIGAYSTRGITGHRNRALLAILWRTGVRISEALELRPHDVDFKNGTVRVRLGKGSSLGRRCFQI